MFDHTCLYYLFALLNLMFEFKVNKEIFKKDFNFLINEI